jgi:hypothetical protein
MSTVRIVVLVALTLGLVIAGCSGNTAPPTDDTTPMDAAGDAAQLDGGAHVDATMVADGGAHDVGVALDGGTADASADVGLDAGVDMGGDTFNPCATVTCTPLDGCHVAGTCNPASGVCTNPYAVDGTLCSYAPGPGTCHTGSCTVSCTDGVHDGTESDIDCGGGTCPTCSTGARCSVDADCQSMGCTTSTMRCASTQCTDGHRDGSETDADCGGGTCLTCAVGRVCARASDCASNACDSVSLTCVATQCTDHQKDGAETDVDCGGGTCSTCAVGLRCLVNGDCASNACDATTLTCVASQCADHRRDGVETDVDCGGGTCPACMTGRTCAINADCATNACDATTLQCDASQCADHRRDGAETDVDCGGGTCPACVTGSMCVVNADCASSACDATTLRCDANPCADHQRDGAETDVDCGGGTCPACATGLRCLADTDCTSQACDGVSLTCVASQCADHRRDGAETDVDCGGGTCPVCSVGLRCTTDTDCMSMACDGVSFVCDSNQCVDRRLDGTETDVDCGGGTCTTLCANGRMCRVNTDCSSMACDAISLQCDASQCIDRHLDGMETDIDCGGGTCPHCTPGQRCLVNSDCTISCDAVSLLCSASLCSDHQRDGAESDIDCGGGTCPTCPIAKRCTVDSDCTSNACDAISLTCVSSQCADHRKDGLETDVDCGGGMCATCATGLRCSRDADCTTNACDAISLTCVANQCIDHRMDGLESDVDCGGGVCPVCTIGQRCNVNTDCPSAHFCNASHICQ